MKLMKKIQQTQSKQPATLPNINSSIDFDKMGVALDFEASSVVIVGDTVIGALDGLGIVGDSVGMWLGFCTNTDTEKHLK